MQHLSPSTTFNNNNNTKEILQTMVDYGYEEACPDIAKYEYGDAAPNDTRKAVSDNDVICEYERQPESVLNYSYGAVSPDDKSGHTSQSSSETRPIGRRCSMKQGGVRRRTSIRLREASPKSANFEYGDAVPDAANEYGYSEATPDRNLHKYQTHSDSTLYVAGEGNAHEDGIPKRHSDPALDQKYGCGAMNPDDSIKHMRQSCSETRRIGRRSSMKQEGVRRRTSIRLAGETSPNAAKYEYGDAAPDDASKYGYGEATPERNLYKDQRHSDPTREKYGHGEATYDDGNPKRHSDTALDKYGYGDANPDKYGYGEASPTPPPSSEMGRMGRRSSMKQSGAPRRSSICFRGEISNVLPGQTQAHRRQLSISFNSSTEVKEVEPARDLTDKPEELWFQKKEFVGIREKAKLLTNIAKESQGESSVEGKKLCLRGLESHINSGYVEMEQNLAWKSVFLEQYHQREGGGFDDEVVARLYEMASMPSRARALERAAGDTKDAKKHTRGVRNAMRRHSMMS